VRTAQAGPQAAKRLKELTEKRSNPLETLRKQSEKEEENLTKNVAYFSRGLKASSIEIELRKTILGKQSHTNKA